MHPNSGRRRRHSNVAGAAITPAVANKAPPPGPTPEFVAIELPAPAKNVARAAADPVSNVEPLIQIELRRGPLHLTVRWPTCGGDDCTAWLRELSSGMLK